MTKTCYGPCGTQRAGVDRGIAAVCRNQSGECSRFQSVGTNKRCKFLSDSKQPRSDRLSFSKPTQSTTANVYVSISDSSYTVTVNGIPATGSWGTLVASNVPVTSGGVATFTSVATSASTNVDQQNNFDKPSRVYVSTDSQSCVADTIYDNTHIAINHLVSDPLRFMAVMAGWRSQFRSWLLQLGRLSGQFRRERS